MESKSKSTRDRDPDRDARAPRTRPAHAIRPRVGAVDEGALDHYFRDIGRVPLITGLQEAELARRIRAGDREALDALVGANLRFVVSVAKQYRNRGVPLPDLINEGNLGLIRAAHKFDETRGVKFISYAVWWIRQAILQAVVEQGSIVRVPLNYASARNQIRRRRDTLLQTLGREATHAEVADGMRFTGAQVADAMRVSLADVSLDAPTVPGAAGCRLDHLADESTLAPDERMFERALADVVAKSLVSLKKREAVILRLYFGLDADEPLTLEQIGGRLGITRERVRQIKAKALVRLRYARHTDLASFFG